MARTSAVSSVLCLLLIAVNATNATLGQYALLRRRSRQREAPLRIDVVHLFVRLSVCCRQMPYTKMPFSQKLSYLEL